MAHNNAVKHRSAPAARHCVARRLRRRYVAKG